MKIPEYIIKTYCIKNDIESIEANLVFQDLENFLHRASIKGKVSPTRKVDQAWHHFIIFTEEYLKYCLTNFNTIIHHKPDVETLLSNTNKSIDCDSKCNSQNDQDIKSKLL